MACSPTFSSGCSVWNRNNSTENVDCPCAYHQWVKRASSDLLAGFRALPPLLVCPVPVLWKFLVPSLSLLVRMEPSPSFHPISLGTPSLSCLCSQWPLSSRYPPLKIPLLLPSLPVCSWFKLIGISQICAMHFLSLPFFCCGWWVFAECSG